jgi:hypothetical protein
MRALPSWILAILVAVTALLLVIGWHDRHEAGPLPFILGIVFALFTFAALGGKVAGEREE